MTESHTPGPWNFACDSYGKVRHSRKACVYVNLRTPQGDRLVAVAKAVANWKDARLIAAAPDLLEAVRELLATHPAAYREPDAIDNRTDNAVRIARAAVAKAEGGQ